MKKKVVIVLENDKNVLEVLRLILSKEYEVYLFTAPPENFFKLLEKKKPDLIIIDWIIPNVVTEDLIVPIRTTFDDAVKIIITSAHNSVHQAFADKPINAILPKPFGAVDLKELIKTLFNADELKTL